MSEVRKSVATRRRRPSFYEDRALDLRTPEREEEDLFLEFLDWRRLQQEAEANERHWLAGAMVWE